MSITINDVTVRLDRSAADWRKYEVVVQVASRVKKNLFASQSIDPGKAINAKQLMKAVAAAAVVGAEYLGKRYGDLVDPAVCERDAIRAFGEECRLLAAGAKDIGAKLKRVKEKGTLNEREREILNRMIWATDRGDRLTRNELDWVNEKIAAIHEEAL